MMQHNDLLEATRSGKAVRVSDVCFQEEGNSRLSNFPLTLPTPPTPVFQHPCFCALRSNSLMLSKMDSSMCPFGASLDDGIASLEAPATLSASSSANIGKNNESPPIIWQTRFSRLIFTSERVKSPPSLPWQVRTHPSPKSRLSIGIDILGK